jgi:protein tyrosine/serine phosphatase
MDTIFRGDLVSAQGRVLAWADSLLVDHGLLRLVWSNFGVVLPGRLYRSNHPPPWRLAALVRRHGIRTLVNLRGPCGNGSDALSRAEAARLGLAFIDAPLSSGRAPQRNEVLTLVEAFGAVAEPILVHCKSGADRAGFAAALFLLLEGETVASALRQLSLRHGHWHRSRAGVLDAFLLRYAREAEGRKPFLDWVREDYDAAALGAEFRPGHFADFITHRVLRRE